MSGQTLWQWLTARGRGALLWITVVPYLILAVLVGFTVFQERSDGRALLVDLALCAALALWTLWMFTLHPAWRERPRVMGVFFTVVVVLTAVLIARHSWYGFLVISAYGYAFALLPWPWRLPGVAVVAVLSGSAQAYDVPRSTAFGLTTYLAVLALNVAIMSGVAWFSWADEKEKARRQQVLAEVSRTNQLLEAALAENAGLHGKLLAQAREAGRIDERQRMAREIHDTVAQGLTGIIAQLQAAEQLREVPAEWRRPFESVKRLARESLSEARRSVDALRPEPLETAHLSEAVADLADRWSKLHGLAVEVTTTGTARPMAPEAEFALLRTAQEALANVAKHARATRVGVTLSYLDREVALDVRDDGAGFDPAVPRSAEPGGFGLRIMRQRVEDLSGVLRIESEPGAGTGISACVPSAPAGSAA
ncbi:sensor histidine kinase [Amycolatopsis sp. CA-230715]|uniref:sensor histidine kinase n=1 Tax=Amycolatopsis sp. CA-230715 TaxID=2745196 RepID=UPI001C327C80|nr:sensor histidine kinase [Amycolatopsis sp. CA-230715]QWF83997.1 hypothetical protein HUW46_07441 [Amycolatopsis sp. CA-230715]